MNRALKLIAALMLFILSSCDMFVTEPNPLVGYYKVSDTKGSVAARFYYTLEENGFFSLSQAGGRNSSEFITFLITL